MPRKNQVKAPTKKRVDGSIYNFEKRDEHNAAIRLCEKLSQSCKKVVHLVKNSHTNEYEKHIQYAKP